MISRKVTLELSQHAVNHIMLEHTMQSDFFPLTGLDVKNEIQPEPSELRFSFFPCDEGMWSTEQSLQIGEHCHRYAELLSE